MVWILLGVVGVLVVGTLALALTGQIAYDPMSQATATTPDAGLPEGRLVAEDVDLVRFDTAFRGYRMDQVDEVLDRLRVRIGELENLAAGSEFPATSPSSTEPMLPVGSGPDPASDPGSDPAEVS